MLTARQGKAGRGRLALLLLGLGGLLLAGLPVVTRAAPPAQVSIEGRVVIYVMALDSTGAGYAWADVCRTASCRVRPPTGGFAARIEAQAVPQAAQATPTPESLLLRITAGRWFVLADSNTAPTLLVPGLDAWRMVVSRNGQEGWAAGMVSRPDAARAPALLRLHMGVWSTASAVLAPDFIPLDLTISGDNGAGWLTARNAAGAYKLWRWDGTQWQETASPPGDDLTYLAISDDGQYGWAVGRGGATTQLYRLLGGAWMAVAQPRPTPFYPVRVTADNAGNGWLLGDQEPGENAPSVLLRLTPAAVKDADFGITASSPGGQVRVNLAEVAVSAGGQGWAAGTMLGAGSGTPLFIRIQGDRAIAVPRAEVALPAGFALPATVVSVSAGGVTTWIGNAAGQLGPLTESAAPGMPRTGAGVTPSVIQLLALALLVAGVGVLLRRPRAGRRIKDSVVGGLP